MNAMANTLNKYLLNRGLFGLTDAETNLIASELNRFNNEEACSILTTATRKRVDKSWAMIGENITAGNVFVEWLRGEGAYHTPYYEFNELTTEEIVGMARFICANLGDNLKHVITGEADASCMFQYSNEGADRYYNPQYRGMLALINDFIADHGFGTLSQHQFVTLVMMLDNKAAAVKNIREVTKQFKNRTWDCPTDNDMFTSWVREHVVIEGGEPAFERLGLKECKHLIDWMIDNKEHILLVSTN